MKKTYPLFPGWFRILFAVVMLACCVTICVCVVDMPRLEQEITELTTSLETSRQREAKQQAEYDEVAALLPPAQSQLAEIQPVADAAKAEADELRSQRDMLREAETAMTAELNTLNTGIANTTYALEVLSAR